MKTIVNSIPGYRVNEYLVVITPKGDLCNRILKIRDDFGEKFQSIHGRYGKPQIALVSFTQYALMEERIINHLQTIAMGYPPFKVELRDFGSFPSHTIYINVLSKIAVQGLVKTIRTETQRLMKLDDEHKPHFMLEPHITIARKLLPWQYEKGWLELSNKHFTARFIAEGITILKRPLGEMKYHHVRHLEFMNMPVATKQGQLF